MAEPRPTHAQSFAEKIHEEERLKRVAVVLVHGQGEQTPMTDVAAFADAVWSTDPDVMAATPSWESDHSPRKGRLFSTPVYDADLSEQRRLVSQKLTVDGRQIVVDFYQFYWADLMPGNRWEHVWHWFVELITRNRHAETPKRLQPIRRIAMGGALLVAVAGLVYAAATVFLFLSNAAMQEASSGLARAIVLTGGFTLLAVATLFTFGITLRPSRRKQAFVWGCKLLFASLVLSLAAGLVRTNQPALDIVSGNVRDLLLQAQAGKVDLHLVASLVWLGVTLLLGVGGALLYALWRRAHDSFLVPVMADSARMFRSSPDNIPNRDRIRRRGMLLLEALHESDRRYDRIVIAAHSLGTFVAFGLLAHYWGSVFKQVNHAHSRREREAVERAAATLRRDRSEATMRGWRAAVRAYGRALADVRSVPAEGRASWRLADYVSESLLVRKIWRRLNDPRRLVTDHPNERRARQSFWRISDFITLGSPLTYAQLLMAESRGHFEQELAQRRWPESPPQSQDPPSGSFVHQGEPHHAALFAATLWTNIYFQSSGLLKGDIVGGPIAKDPPDGLGPGILDICVKPARHHPDFAHNEYWRRPPRIDEDEPSTPRNIEALRAALNFFDRDQASDDLLFDLKFRRERGAAA